MALHYILLPRYFYFIIVIAFMGLCYSNLFIVKPSNETIDRLIVIKGLLCKKKEEQLAILLSINKELLCIEICFKKTNVDEAFSIKIARINRYIELFSKKTCVERQLRILNIDIRDISVQIDVLERLYKLIDFDMELYR